MRKTHYFRTDISRLLRGYPVYLAVIGVALSLLFSLENYAFAEGMVGFNALDTYTHAADGSGVLIAYAFCALPFATVFCEDLEHHYLRYSINRGSAVKYVLSKAAVIYFSSVITMILGSVLFVLYIRSQLDWMLYEENLGFYMAGMYRSLLAGEHYGAYVFMLSLQLGMLAGALSLCAAFLSLFISNRMFVLITPVLVHQILTEYRGNGWMNIMIFIPYFHEFQSDLQYFLVVCAFSLIPSALFTWGIYRKIKSRL